MIPCNTHLIVSLNVVAVRHKPLISSHGQKSLIAGFGRKKHVFYVSVFPFRVAGEVFLMKRYYFDITNAHGFHRDDLGDMFASLDDARMQAQCLLPDIAREELPDGELHIITCEVRDEAGRAVYRGRLTYEGTRDPG